jgi:hypothetical protein
MGLMGAVAAFAQQCRFAAAESVSTRHIGRAVSFVLVGAIIAGALWPEIGRRGRDLFDTEFAGAFVIVTLVQVVAMAILMGLRMPQRQGLCRLLTLPGLRPDVSGAHYGASIG